MCDDVRRGRLDTATARRDYGVAIVENVVDTQATRLLRRSAPRYATDGVGQERAAWDDVFTPQLLDQLANALSELPVARRQSVRCAFYVKVLAHLPDGFPAVPG